MDFSFFHLVAAGNGVNAAPASASGTGTTTSPDAMVIVLQDAMAEVVIMAAASVVAVDGA
jgi:hypothetical protein